MRPLLWLIPCLLLTTVACEQFAGSGPPLDPGPGPGPGPDPDPLPDPPERTVVFTPGTTVTAGVTVSGTTTGDPFVEGDLIKWTLLPAEPTVATFPRGAGPVVFPGIADLTTQITTDSISPVPARWRLAPPGNYTIEVREEGLEYDPVVRTFPLISNAASATELRPESTEITDIPVADEESFLEGVVMPRHGAGVSTGSDGLGDILTLMVRQTRKDSTSGDTFHEFALYLGDVESGLWSLPIVLSVDPADRVPATPQFPLREYGVTVQQSFGQVTSGRSIDCLWPANTGEYIWKSITLTATSAGALDATISPRRVLDPATGFRIAPAVTPAGATVVTCTSGTPIQEESLVTFTLNRAAGTSTRQVADLIRNNEPTARIFGHDAAFRSDGSLVLATLERSQVSDNQPSLIFAQLPAALTGTATFTVLGSDRKATEPPAIYVAGGDVVHIAHLGDPEVTYYRQRSGTTFEARTIAATGEGSVRTIRMSASASAPGEVLVLMQYGTGLVIENIVGTLRLHRIATAADGAFDDVGVVMPASLLDIADQGPGNVVGSSAGFHVIWQQTGIGLNRNTRLVEARTG